MKHVLSIALIALLAVAFGGCKKGTTETDKTTTKKGDILLEVKGMT